MPPCKSLKRNKSGLLVPCGTCINCRINHSSMWSTRLMMELPYWEKSSFITLSLAPEFMHENGTLSKRDLQLFWKRVRKKFDCSIKYYACGEYGDASGDADHVGRSHYHAIVFGVDFAPWIHVGWKDGRKIYSSDTLRDLWPFGVVSVDDVTMTDCQYVAGYVQKKIYGQNFKWYTDQGVIPPFSLQSKGLSLRYLMEHAAQLYSNGFLWIRGKRVPLPRYVKDKLGLTAKDEFGISEQYLRSKEIIAKRLAAFKESEGFDKVISPISEINHEFNFLKMQRSAAIQSAMELESKQNKRSFNEI